MSHTERSQTLAEADCPAVSTSSDSTDAFAFEALIADLSSRFVNLAPDELDHEIEDALRRVCEQLDIDLALLWQWSDAPGCLVPTHGWCAIEGLRPSEPMRQDQYPVPDKPAAGGHPGHRPFACGPAGGGGRRSGDAPPLRHQVGRGPSARRGEGKARGRPGPQCPPGGPRLARLAGDAAAAHRAGLLPTRSPAGRHDLNLRESEERLTLAADAAEAGLWTLDIGTGLIWGTDRARALFGYSPDEVIDMARFEASVHPDDRGAVRDALERSARTGEPIDVVYRIVRPADGRVRWISGRGGPPAKPAGKADRLMGVSIDITDRRATEEALRVGQARLQAAAELAGLGSIEVDEATGTVFADDRLLDIVGYPPEAERGMPIVHFWMEHLHPDDLPRVLGERQEALDRKREELRVEYRYLHPVRGERWIQHIGRPTWRDAAGFAVRSVAVLRDITERRQREEALRQSLAEIERLKDRLQAESDYLKAEIKTTHAHREVTGESDVIRKVLRQVEQVAPTDSSVLVRGETGSGKELVAQAIHQLSQRKGQVMVKVNCAALPSGLVESELFGREKGAYTGAMTRQVGRFEVADRSTLFLDEVGELSLEVQAKLLRVLETGEFERLGSPKTIKVDVRLIAATNRDLLEEIKKGRFREDLYYRLNVFPIRVPPLRERPDDIPVLVWAFLEEFSSRMGKKITQVPRKTMEALQRYPWPGNVRELRNVIEHSAIVTTGDTLKVPMLDDVAVVAAAAPPRQTLADSERDLIVRALESTRWRIKGPTGAAAALGLRPSTLYSRMKKLGIRPHGPEVDGAA